MTNNNAGRLKTLTTGSSTEVSIYNALGQRIEISGGANGTVLYVDDEAGHLLGEYDATGALIEETVWLGDTPVATLRPSGATVAIYYVHSDQLNTPRQITRPSDNVAMWTWNSDPFGTDAANANPSGAGAFAYNLRFPGQVFDAEAGLHQNWYRDSDPATGKYWESDPMGLKAGINTYAYVKDNPESFNDPTGLLTASTWGCDGLGNYVTFVIDTNPCTSDCTKAHEQQHIADAKAKWRSELCRNKPKGYIPTAPENALPGYNWAYKHATECRAYRVEDACLAKMEGKCGCKGAAHARRYSALEGIDSNCNGT